MPKMRRGDLGPQAQSQDGAMAWIALAVIAFVFLIAGGIACDVKNQREAIALETYDVSY